MLKKRVIPLKNFNKIVVNPYIQVTFEQGKKESIIIENISVPFEKFNIEQSGNTLHIYLEDAKMATKNKTDKNNNRKIKHAIYKRTIIRATIIYKKLVNLSLRSEEEFTFQKI